MASPHIGIDFGMTNSVLAYADADALRLFKRGADEYIPTAIVVRENGVTIGSDARQLIVQGTEPGRMFFKFDIRADDWEATGTRDAVLGYLRELLRLYAAESLQSSVGNPARIETLVLSLPQGWYDDRTRDGPFTRMTGLLRELSCTNGGFAFELTSEPIAAAAFFWHAHRTNARINPSGQPFVGSVLVVDYGGGSLDISLCRCDASGHITPLTSSGTRDIEHAGVAFDRAVVRDACRRAGLTPGEDDATFLAMCAAFERAKIALNDSLNVWMVHPDAYEDKIVWTYPHGDATLTATPSDLQAAFERVSRQALGDALERVRGTFGQYGVDASDGAHFRVLLVGGFSNFMPVEQQLREAFGVSTRFEDQRFHALIERADRAFAVGKGNALFASGVIRRADALHYGMGVQLAECTDDGRIEWRDVPLLRCGQDVAEVREAAYADERALWVGGTADVHVYVQREDGARGAFLVPVGGGAGDAVPRWVRFGASVGYDGPVLHVDAEGEATRRMGVRAYAKGLL